MANYGTGGYKRRRGQLRNGQAGSGWRNNSGLGGGPKPPRGIHKINAPHGKKTKQGCGCLIWFVIAVVIVIIAVAAGRH